MTDDLNQTAALPPHNDADIRAASEPVSDENIPRADTTSGGVRWRGTPEHTPDARSQTSSPGDCISIRVKFLENERTLTVNKAITVGQLKRYF